MAHVWRLGAALALALAVPRAAIPQTVSSPPRYVVIDDAVRAMFAADWDDVHPNQHERAYCLAYVVSSQWGVPVYRVWAASPATLITSTPYSITYRCPVGPNIATAHVHPPSTCEEPSDCHLNGPDSYECFPSPLDEFTLVQSGDPFAVILCDKHAAVPFYPRAVR